MNSSKQRQWCIAEHNTTKQWLKINSKSLRFPQGTRCLLYFCVFWFFSFGLQKVVRWRTTNGVIGYRSFGAVWSALSHTQKLTSSKPLKLLLLYYRMKKVDVWYPTGTHYIWRALLALHGVTVGYSSFLSMACLLRKTWRKRFLSLTFIGIVCLPLVDRLNVLYFFTFIKFIDLSI